MMKTVLENINIAPLSHSQKRFSYVEMRHPNTPINVVGFVSMIDGNVDFVLLKRAIMTYISRNEAFRLRFTEVEGEIRQYARKGDLKYEIGFRDFSGMAEPTRAMNEWLDQNTKEPIAYTDEQLFEITMFRLCDESGGFLTKFHHMIGDGWSTQLLTRAIGDLYMNELNKEERGITKEDQASYLGSVTEQEEAYFASARSDRDRRFWKEQFSTLPVPMFEDDPDQIAGARSTFLLGHSLSAKLKQLMNKLDCSDNTIFTGLILLYLHLNLRRDDLVIGTPVFNRSGRREKEIFGLFTSLMPLRVRVDSVETVHHFLLRLKRVIRQCYMHQKYPYDLLVQDLELRRSGMEQLFQVTVNCFNTSMRSELNGWKMKHREFYSGCQINPLQFVINDWNNEGNYTVDIQYKTSLFSEEVIATMMSSLQNLLKQVTDHPDILVRELSFIDEGERSRQLYEFNDTKFDIPEPLLVHEWLEVQARRIPERTALVCRDIELTYAELNMQANRIAHQLRVSGIGPDCIVGIMAERSVEMIVGIYGIIKAGGAYLPIDPTYPQDRIKYLLEDSGAQILLIQPKLKESFRLEQSGIIMMDLELGKLDERGETTFNLPLVNQPRDLIYMIYTSGSTGLPKGVMIEHHAVINFILGVKASVPMAEETVVLCVTTLSFDIFVLETLLPLSSGMKVIIADESEQLDGARLHNLMVENKIDLLQMTPSRMQLLLEDGRQGAAFDQLKVILLGGEPLPQNLLKRLKQLTSARIYNMYGPTETTVWSTVQELTHEDDPITIGKPIANTAIYILDEHRELLPIGSAGELCISGFGLSRGYWNRPELTAERFIDHPFVTGEKLYLTGDLAKWLPDGRLQHLGRMDHQVKVRGYRIELGEIENSLMQHAAVGMAVVKDWTNQDGFQELAAYMTARSAMVEPLELREHLALHLPSYMIPTYFVWLESIPYTPNGKIDRNALPAPWSQAREEPDVQRLGETSANVMDELEQTIAGCWSQILSGHDFHRDDHFFKNGGHSLHVLKIISNMKERGIPAQASDMYAEPTIAGLAALLRQRHGSFHFRKWNEEEGNTPISSSIQVLPAITANRDDYGWERVNCFIKPMAILFESFHTGYFDLFLFYTNYYMTFFADDWKLEPFERESEPNSDFFQLYEQKLEPIFQLNITKINFSNEHEIRAQLKVSLEQEHRILVPGDLFGLYYSNHYLSEPHTHYFIVKGYDAKRDLVYVLDNMHIEEGAKPKYTDFVIRIDDLVSMAAYYASHWCPEGTMPYYWSIAENPEESSSLTWRHALLDHADQLDRWYQDHSLIRFIEEEIVREIESRHDFSRITRLIPLTNYKFVYYQLLFSFMGKANIDNEELEKLRELSTVISEEWEKLRLKIFNCITDLQYELGHLKPEIADIVEKEKQFFSSVRQLLLNAGLENRLYSENEAVQAFKIMELNRKEDNIRREGDILTMLHTTDRVDDTWILKDESPQLLLTPNAEEFSFEAKVINHNKYGPCFHSGLIIKFKDHSKIMFGNARRKLLGVFCPERTDNYEVFVRPDTQPLHYLRIRSGDGRLSFYVKYEMEAEWELLCQIALTQPIRSIGLFSKTWEPTHHRTEFSEVIYQQGENENEYEIFK